MKTGPTPVVITILAGLAVLGTACTPEEMRDFANRTHPRADVVTITEFQKDAPNVSPPQRLDEVMSLVTFSPIEIESAIARCNDSGGTPRVWSAPVYKVVCEGIDY